MPAHVDRFQSRRDNAPDMAAPSDPPPVKLFCGMIVSQTDLFDPAQAALEEAFGPVDLASDVFDFDLTHYYDKQMGSPLYRRFVCFADVADPSTLAEAKLKTHAIEAEFAARYNFAPRPINLDVGYIELAKLVLASMKNFAHRVYLSGGVYAEVTLLYRKGRWEALEWTFSDFASGRYDAFLTDVRRRLHEQSTAVE